MPERKSFIAVCGPGKANPELLALAEAVGQELALAGFGVVCGGRGGVMEAACRGAKAAGGSTLGILPGYDAGEANQYVDIPVCTGMGEARNVIVVATGEAVIAVGGEWGTLSEIALALKLGKQVIALAGYGWKLTRASENDPLPVPVKVASTPAEAVQFARAALNR